MKKFEYKLVNTKSGFFSGINYQRLNDYLDTLGIQGWEVVSTVGVAVGGHTTGLLVTLKREIQQYREIQQ